MNFRNIKTGNIVAARDALTAELMQRSPIYIKIEPTPAKATRKPAAKKKAPEKAE